jgi:hypothetical protein
MSGEPVTHREVCNYYLLQPNQNSMNDEERQRVMGELGVQLPGNPALVWLGYSPRDKRRPVQWELVRGIDVRRIISKGLNPDWKRALDAVGGSFYRFVTECQDAYGAEYNRDRLPSPEVSLIMGIIHPAKPEEVEMIDGAHRLASRILNGKLEVDGYIGRY